MQSLKLGFAIKLDGRVVGYVTTMGYLSIKEIIAFVNQGVKRENFVVKGSAIRPKGSLEMIELPKVWYLGYNNVPQQLYEFAFQCYKYRYVAKNNARQEVIAFSNDRDELVNGCKVNFRFDMYPVHGVEENKLYKFK